ncbi:MAG: aa3-type cytochrome c oxidase subunit IV [Parvibaculum sp.]|nr:aa3-type cytochrome c oxidase subunit IV [Parvibaculum sp.]
MTDNKSASGWGAEMQPDAHIGTYNGFLTGTKIGSAILIVILVGMAIFLL